LELGKTGEIGIDTVPFLVEALRYSKDSVVRGAAAEALGELGAIARDAVPSLEAASVEESKDVRKKAVRALQKIRLSTNKQTGFVLP
jgi:HEAT repeat protein